MPFCPRYLPVPLWVPVVSALMALPACSEHTVEVSRWAPASIHLQGVGSLKIDDFAGEGGTDWTELLRLHLVEANYFAVVGPDAGAPAPDLRGLAQNLPAAQVPDAIIKGEVVYAGEIVTLEARAQDAGPQVKCQMGRTVRAQLEVALDIVDSQLGTLLTHQRLHFDEALQAEYVTAASNTAGRTCSQSDIDVSAYFAPLDSDLLQLRAKALLAQSLVGRLTPQYRTEPVTFYADPRLKGAQQGVDAARAGNWNEAVNHFEDAKRQAYSHALGRKYLAKAHYNLAVALAFGRDYEQGLTELQRACELGWVPLFTHTMDQIERSQRAEQIARARQQTVQCLRDGHHRPTCHLTP